MGLTIQVTPNGGQRGWSLTLARTFKRIGLPLSTGGHGILLLSAMQQWRAGTRHPSDTATPPATAATLVRDAGTRSCQARLVRWPSRRPALRVRDGVKTLTQIVVSLLRIHRLTASPLYRAAVDSTSSPSPHQHRGRSTQQGLRAKGAPSS